MGELECGHEKGSPPQASFILKTKMLAAVFAAMNREGCDTHGHEGLATTCRHTMKGHTEIISSKTAGEHTLTKDKIDIACAREKIRQCKKKVGTEVGR